MNRKRLFKILEPSEGSDIASTIYDIFMMVMIVLSIIPLMFRNSSTILLLFDRVSVTVFIIDYILNWITADIKRPNQRKIVAFLTYPLTPLAILDLLSILPSINVMHRTLKVLRVVRLLKLIRVFRFLRYSKRIQTLVAVLRKERVVLLTVLAIAVFYIFATSLVMFNVEMFNRTDGGELVFNSFFEALYWATTTLTTVGYGDIYPVSSIGRLVSMISSLFGVAIIALPSGVITASYLDELKKIKEQDEENKNKN